MPRILSLDLAKGFTVLIMPSVHVMMLYSKPQVQQSIPGVFLQFLAEGPGAQLFMFAMGVSISLSKTLTTKKVFQRTMYLFAGGFALNLFKFVIPRQVGLLPAALLDDFPLTDMEFFLLGDIFQFAAIAYPLTYLVSKLRYHRYAALLFALAIMLLSPLLWDVKTENIVVNQVLVYFNGQPPRTFFPVLPWLVYPLTGLGIGKSIVSKKISLAGIAAITLSLLLPSTAHYTSFYRTLPADTLFHAGIVLVWMGLFTWVSQKVKMNAGYRLLIFCSRHISLIYILQWLLIFWCIPLAGYSTLTLLPTVYWMAGMTALTLLLTYGFQKSL